jgi:menaquinone-9 beta-reductase
MTDSFDAIVIGGGPAGGTMGLLLARAGWRVALLERKSFPRRKVCGEFLSAPNLALLGELGLREEFLDQAGPPVTHVGLFAGARVLRAELSGRKFGWGRALSREILDTWLLETASRQGLHVLQPFAPVSLNRQGPDYVCRARSLHGDEQCLLRAPVVVAAHGSWEPGPLPTQPRHVDARPNDLLGFKAHFLGSRLPKGLMPLLAFPDGYGGMVHCDSGRVSLSCCLRRDRLARLPRLTCEGSGKPAGEAVLNHIRQSCPAVRIVLENAHQEGEWLAVGPIRPGIHLQAPPGIFRVGNAAGEAHPAIAEGISMAMQGAWLLFGHLEDWRQSGASPADLGRVGAAYAEAWQRNFSARIQASALIAHLAMRPATVSLLLPLLRLFPRLMTWAAQCTGKARQVVRG